MLLSKNILEIAGFVVLGVSAMQAQSGPTGTRVRRLGDDLLRLRGESQAALLAPEAEKAIEERAAALAALIEQDPAQALSFAFSPELVADLAAKFPVSAHQLETWGTWQGPVEYSIIDGPDLRWHRTVRRLRVGEQWMDLHLVGPEPTGLRSGEIIMASGISVGNMLAAGTVQRAAPAAGDASAVAACSTTGVQNTAVLLVTLPGVTPPPAVTPQSVYDIFFGSAGRSVDGYWREASHGQMSASGNVYGWYTLDSPYACTQLDQVRDAAIAKAANAGVDIRSYSRIFLVFPEFGCGWSGLAIVGCSSLNSPAGSFTASSAYLSASYLSTRDQGVALAVHEGGHNLGLGHAAAREFGTEALGPLGAAGTLGEYDDMFSAMGSGLGHYAAPHKAGTLHWMADGVNYQTVQNGGTWLVQPSESNAPGIQALRIQRGTGNNAWLWLEYRQPTGNYDSTLPSQSFSGALLHYEDSSTGSYSQLLDFTPQTPSILDPALAAGQTWVDPYTNLSISVQSATASALTVTVNYGSAPCTRGKPSVSMTPANPAITPGSSVSYTVSITNTDAGCATSTFNLTSSQPAAWPTTFSSTSLVLGPGQTGWLTMTKTAPAGTAPAIYPVEAAVSNGWSSGSATANCTVASAPALSVTVSVSGSSYTLRQAVPIVASVSNGGSAAAGASVTFTLSKPDGGRAVKTITAGSTGKATWSYKLSPKDPTGAYSVSAQATYGPQTTTSSPAMFTVR